MAADRLGDLAASRRRWQDRRAFLAAREAHDVAVAASDRWHGARWLRGLYAALALLAWIAGMTALGWRSRPVVVELRAGTLRLDALELPLDQVAGAWVDGPHVRLLLHTGDELWTRALGPEAHDVVERVPISAEPVDPSERAAIDRLVRAAR
jgi:hypothetical protein